MKTAVIQIGNSDDKLTQLQWSRLVNDISSLVLDLDVEIHFSAPSAGDAPWQNYCLVIVINDQQEQRLRDGLTEIRKRYLQDSVAVLIGHTQFI